MKKKRKRVPKYQGGGFTKKQVGELGRNAVLGYADYLTGTLGADNVIQDSAYKGTGSEVIRTGADISGQIGKAVLPMALSAAGVPPQATMTGQAAISGLNPEAELKPTGIPQEQPIVENDAYNYFKMGGMIPQDNTIEVEGKELETSKGKILKDFNKQPTHKKGGFQYEAKPDRVIIPSKLRDRYMEGDKTTRTSIEKNLVNEQAARESEKRDSFNTMFNKWRKKGGYTIPKFDGPPNGNSYTGVPEYYINDKKDSNDILSLKPPYAPGYYGEQAFYPTPDGAYNQSESDGNVIHSNKPMVYAPPSNAEPRGNFASMEYLPNTTLDQLPVNTQVGNVPSTVTPVNNTGTVPPTSQQNWGNYANQAAQFAPIAYNLAKGLQKPQVLNQEEFQNPYESQVKGLMRNRNIDFKPIEDEIRNNYTSAYGKLGAGAKSSGQVLSGSTALAGSRASTLAKAKLRAQEINAGFRGEEAGMLGNLGVRRASTKLGIQDINDRNKAARNSFQGQTALEAQKYGNADQYNDMIGKTLGQRYEDWTWDPYSNSYIPVKH